GALPGASRWRWPDLRGPRAPFPCSATTAVSHAPDYGRAVNDGRRGPRTATRDSDDRADRRSRTARGRPVESLEVCAPVRGATEYRRERCGGSAPRHQHSITFTARPPRAVSLYLTFMSLPGSRMVLITLSSETRWLPLPRSAIRAAVIALTEAT